MFYSENILALLNSPPAILPTWLCDLMCLVLFQCPAGLGQSVMCLAVLPDEGAGKYPTSLGWSLEGGLSQVRVGRAPALPAGETYKLIPWGA